MDQAQREQLTRYVKAAEKVDTVVGVERWCGRVRAFFETSLDPREARKLIRLGENLFQNDSFEKLALWVGHLEGLIAISEHVPTDRFSRPSIVEMEAPELRADASKVFIVHGHDNGVKETVARFLEKLGLDPVILHEQASEGRTIIEKFEVYSKDVGYAVVLLTPDDLGSAVGHEQNLQARARQNVILELGYFMGRLGRTRVCALHKSGIEFPSDYQGVVYIELDGAGGWKTKLAQEFVQAKFAINQTGLL